MAAGVFVEQGVIEEEARFVDGGIEGNERALAQIRRPLVHREDLAQQRLSPRRPAFDRLSPFKAQPEIFDELAAERERLDRVHGALRTAAHGGGEHLFGGDVGVEILAAHRALFAGDELRLGDEAHAQAGAVGAAVFQRFEVQGVDLVALFAQGAVVPHPIGQRVFAVGAAHLQDELPQVLHRRAGAVEREQLFCPADGGHRRHAPLVAVDHGVAVLLGDGRARHLGKGQLFAVRPLHCVRRG